MLQPCRGLQYCPSPSPCCPRSRPAPAASAALLALVAGRQAAPTCPHAADHPHPAPFCAARLRQGFVWAWGRQVRATDVRLAARTASGEERYVFCPAYGDLAQSPAQQALFEERWGAGEPVIVRGCPSKVPWDAKVRRPGLGFVLWLGVGGVGAPCSVCQDALGGLNGGCVPMSAACRVRASGALAA